MRVRTVLSRPVLWAAAAIVAAAAIFAGNAMRGSDVIRSDEEIIFFPTYIRTEVDVPPRIGRSPAAWVGRIHGWVFEPERDDLLRKAALGSLKAALDLEEGAEETELFLERARGFLVDNERSKNVRVRLAGDGAPGDVIPAGTSAADGHFESEIRLDPFVVQNAGARDPSPFLRIRAVLAEGDARVFEGEIHVAGKEGISVVSDIDDTIKISEVHDKKALLANTLLREYRAVPGMADLYRELELSADAFHYVSNSPWQLYPHLRRFADANRFPPGTYHMRPFRWKDRSFFRFLRSGRKHKIETIEQILGDFPERRFILVGDSGEEDPEIYGEIARAHPGQVQAILIRDPTGDGTVTARLEAAFAGIPRERWIYFDDAKKIDAKALAPAPAPPAPEGDATK